MSALDILAELPHLSEAELALVQAKLHDLVTTRPAPTIQPIAGHAALGIWKNRTDLPADPVEASATLRERLMRGHETLPS